MRGYHVPRKAGWDTHGLPVEIEVEKRLGFSGKQQIEAYGIAEFNQRLPRQRPHLRDAVAGDDRADRLLGGPRPRLPHLHRTSYIESVWWALSELAARGLLDEGYKIQPYCARCGTTLSSHEVAQNYKDAEDPVDLDPLPRPRRAVDPDASTARRWAVGDNVYLVAWTTTPWTTIANVGLAVHPDLIYKRRRAPGEAGRLILLSARTSARRCRSSSTMPSRRASAGRSTCATRRRPLARFRGRDLEGLLYDRLYTFFEPEIAGAGGARRLRDVDGRHRARPHRAAVRRGRLPDGPALRPADDPLGRRRGEDGRRRRAVRRPLVQGRRSQDHPGSEEPAA